MPLGDFLGILILLLQEKVKLSMIMEPWHLLFYRLKNENIAGKPKFFERMRFDWDGPYPKSLALEHYLNCLVMFGTLVTTSPRFREYKLESRHVPLLRNKYDALNETAKQFLDNAIKLALEEFNRVPQ